MDRPRLPPHSQVVPQDLRQEPAAGAHGQDQVQAPVRAGGRLRLLPAQWAPARGHQAGGAGQLLVHLNALGGGRTAGADAEAAAESADGARWGVPRLLLQEWGPDAGARGRPCPRLGLPGLPPATGQRHCHDPGRPEPGMGASHGEGVRQAVWIVPADRRRASGGCTGGPHWGAVPPSQPAVEAQGPQRRQPLGGPDALGQGQLPLRGRVRPSEARGPILGPAIHGPRRASRVHRPGVCGGPWPVQPHRAAPAGQAPQPLREKGVEGGLVGPVEDVDPRAEAAPGGRLRRRRVLLDALPRLPHILLQPLCG
mmetsp:Transcript_99735/g.171797  ORF Transcript_99735/g.171797 Transcript_99735/m.171797 type:complete len:311 (-) Transcript_99735:1240-2172(-)